MGSGSAVGAWRAWATGFAAASVSAGTTGLGGLAGLGGLPAFSAVSFASKDSTNWPSSFSDTCCSIPLPNWASLPTIFRSVSTVTFVRPPSSCSWAVTVAAALPVPRASLPLPSMTARCWSRSCSTKRTLPLNSLVTGPTLTLTFPRYSSPSWPISAAPGISGITCSRSHSTSQACSIGALTVNWLAIFILWFLSCAAVFDERVADQGAIVGRLGQCPKAGQRRIDRIGRGNICDAQRHQSRYPVDGLGHAGRLVQVKITRAAHELGGMLDQRCRRPGHRPADNRGRPGRLRVIDPMVEAAPPQCVV